MSADPGWGPVSDDYPGPEPATEPPRPEPRRWIKCEAGICRDAFSCTSRYVCNGPGASFSARCTNPTGA